MVKNPYPSVTASGIKNPDTDAIGTDRSAAIAVIAKSRRLHSHRLAVKSADTDTVSCQSSHRRCITVKAIAEFLGCLTVYFHNLFGYHILHKL